MPKVRVLNIEDNPIHREQISILVDELGYEICGMADNAGDAIALLFSTKPDVILVDIEIVGDINGIQLAERINEINPTPIIFTTGLSDIETIHDANATEPYAYLIKPIDKNNLRAAIELAIYQFSLRERGANAQEDEFVWDEGLILKDSLFVKQGNGLKKIDISEIKAIQSERDRYCLLYTKDENYRIRTSLKNMMDHLPNEDFIQIHRSVIINIHHITSIQDKIHLGSLSMPMARRFKEKLLKKIKMI